MVVNFALFIIFLRFIFQMGQIDPKHPYAQSVYRLSAVVTVFRQIFPDINKGRISLSALILILLLTYIEIAGMASVLGKDLTALQLFVEGTLQAVLGIVTGLRYTLLFAVVLSFITMFNGKMQELTAVMEQLSEPIVAPFRRITPNLGMLDLSYLVALLLLGLLETVIEIIEYNIRISLL